MGAAREHGVIDALNAAGVRTVANTAYQGGGHFIRVPQCRRRPVPETGRYRHLSRAEPGQRRPCPAAQPGERANAQLKSWAILGKIRSCPGPATVLVKAVTVLIQTS
jgi:hypothetical protein